MTPIAFSDCHHIPGTFNRRFLRDCSTFYAVPSLVFGSSSSHGDYDNKNFDTKCLVNCGTFESTSILDLVLVRIDCSSQCVAFSDIGVPSIRRTSRAEDKSAKVGFVTRQSCEVASSWYHYICLGFDSSLLFQKFFPVYGLCTDAKPCGQAFPSAALPDLI